MRIPGRAAADAGPEPPRGGAGPLLTVTGLARSFGQMPVLTGVDLRLGPGEAVAVTGPNGAGKTTLLRCVAGLDRPSSGTVELCGRPLREQEPAVRRRVAAVLDGSQRRRLALATCFARPRLLVLLDEPEQRLDTAGRPG